MPVQNLGVLHASPSESSSSRDAEGAKQKPNRLTNPPHRESGSPPNVSGERPLPSAHRGKRENCPKSPANSVTETLGSGSSRPDGSAALSARNSIQPDDKTAGTGSEASDLAQRSIHESLRDLRVSVLKRTTTEAQSGKAATKTGRPADRFSISGALLEGRPILVAALAKYSISGQTECHQAGKTLV